MRLAVRRAAAGYRRHMTTNVRLVEAPAAKVWEVLADGWFYPLWVVGASRCRAVDASWPAVGARIEHSVGLWPLLIDDHTAVVECEPGRMIALRARAWPLGEAGVRITLEDQGGRTRVRIEEDAVSGPGRLIPQPLRGATLKWRNVESLRRLALIAENR